MLLAGIELAPTKVGTCFGKWCVLFILGRTRAWKLEVLTCVCNSLIYSSELFMNLNK